MHSDISLLKKELEATQEQFWNIAPEAGQLLQALIFTHTPKQILEIGTSNGYSAILMAEIASQYGGHITSIEFHEKRIILAQDNLAKAGLSDSVTILQGDALEVLKKFQDERFDFVFIDANKKQCGDYFTQCIRVANPGAIIVADNTISHRHSLDSFFEAIKHTKNIDILESEIGTGLVIIKVT